MRDILNDMFKKYIPGRKWLSLAPNPPEKKNFHPLNLQSQDFASRIHFLPRRMKRIFEFWCDEKWNIREYGITWVRISSLMFNTFLPGGKITYMCVTYVKKENIVYSVDLSRTGTYLRIQYPRLELRFWQEILLYMILSSFYWHEVDNKMFI